MQATIPQRVSNDNNYKIQNINLWKIAAIFIAAIFFIPTATIIASLFIPNQEIWQHLYQTILDEYLINSFVLASGVGIITVVLGVSTAWLVTMYQFPMSAVFKYALLLPMAFPAYIVAYTYTGILDVSGPFQEWIRMTFEVGYGEYWFPEIRSMQGAIFVMSLVLYPYVYLLTRAALLEQSICVLEVARTLGCRPLNVFIRVALPLLRPAIIVGLSLVLMEALADYGTVQYFGVNTFTTGIFRTWFAYDNSLGATQLSACLLSLIIILIYVEQYSRKQSKYFHSSNRYSKIIAKKLHGSHAWLTMLYCLLILILGFLLPLFFIIQWSFITYHQVIDEEFVRLVWNSFVLAITTAVIAVVVSLFLVYGKRRYKGFIMPTILKILSYGYAVPGVIIAAGVMTPVVWFDKNLNVVVKQLLNLEIGLIFSSGVSILVFAYLVRFLAISLNTLDTSIQKIKPSIDEATMSLGFRSFSMIKKIHIPMMKSGLLTALLMIFVDVLKELPATLILRPFNFNTLAVKTYELANEERLYDAAIPSLAIVLVGLIPVIILSLSINRSRPGDHAAS